MSSPPSVLSSIVNGGVIEAFKISNLETKTSMAPVGILEFLDSLSITVPVTCITNSLPKDFAFSIISVGVRSSSKINCVTPYLSRKSTQIIKPLSRVFCTQPAKVIFVFMCDALNSPQE